MIEQRRKSLDDRTTLGELFGPDIEDLMAESEVVDIKIEAVRAKLSAIAPEIEAAKVAFTAAVETGTPDSSDTSERREFINYIFIYKSYIDELNQLVSKYSKLIKLIDSLLYESCPFFVPSTLVLVYGAPAYLFKVGSVRVLPLNFVADIGNIDLRQYNLFFHFYNWMIKFLLAASRAADAEFASIRNTLDALGAFVELAARRCLEAIGDALVVLRLRGLGPIPGPKSVSTGRELIGELLAPAIMAAGGNLGAFVTRC